ncbi:MAG: hypothetical protein CW335_01555, partial [Clostridiales bacterium]|nr:hypothetical protein [Clostridiales bacterium]
PIKCNGVTFLSRHCRLSIKPQIVKIKIGVDNIVIARFAEQTVGAQPLATKERYGCGLPPAGTICPYRF